MLTVPSTVSCDAVFVPYEDWNDGEGHPPGAFTIETWNCGTKAMLYNCPSDGSEGLLRLRPCNGERPSWEFNGDLDRPALTPSVHRVFKRGDGSQSTIWHGWLRNGRWESC
jgi:hypothetical protein